MSAQQYPTGSKELQENTAYTLLLFLFIFCSLIASGASGARGRDNKMQSHADEIRALIRLEANETIFILVSFLKCLTPFWETTKVSFLHKAKQRMKISPNYSTRRKLNHSCKSPCRQHILWHHIISP
jgi:hypothetical protein